MIDLRSYGGALFEVGVRTATRRQESGTLAAMLVGYPAWQGVVRGARALDHVVAPGQRDQPVTAPVFLIGHPRSGTTLLHRLLALDPRFSAPAAWQLLLPAVSLYRAVGRARRLGLGGGAAARLERRLFAGFAESHETHWDAAEEDDWLFLHAAASPTLEYLTAQPALTRRWWLGDALPERDRERAMHWYRRSVQRHLFATDPDATLLSKNPHFTGWIRTLNAAFPDARFAMLVRDPAEAIASRLGMITKAWERTQPMRSRSDARLTGLLQTSCAVYRHAEEAWKELPTDRKLRVGYAGLVRDPLATVQGIYAHFGWTLAPAVQEAVSARADEARRRVPGRPALLRHHGIRPSELAAALGGIDPLAGAL